MMREGNRVTVVIPALNEEQSIGPVRSTMPGWIDEVIVVANGSTDRTAETAATAGANVVREFRRGYGAASLAGFARSRSDSILVFMDADASDDPRDMAHLVEPVVRGEADLVIGSRTTGGAESGALTPQAVLGNWLACALMRLRWGGRFTDLGPFRVIRRETLASLRMADRGYGWTVGMQIGALKHGLRCMEVPVRYRKRVGSSKISGTVRGVIGAGTRILTMIAYHAIRRSLSHRRPGSMDASPLVKRTAGGCLLPRERFADLLRCME